MAAIWSCFRGLSAVRLSLRLAVGVAAFLMLGRPPSAGEFELPAAVPIPAARDIPYPGVIALNVDATELTRGIFSIHETIPVEPGHLVLLIPKWQPGAHSVQLPVADIAGLVFEANGKRLAWRRDPADVYAFNLNVPEGVSSLSVAFKYLSPTAPAQGRIMMTPYTLDLEWSSNLLYPAGYYARDIMISPTVRFPNGWISATSLIGRSQRRDTIRYPTTDLDTLVDSPVMAGAHSETVDLGHHAQLNVFWDRATGGKVAAWQIACFERLVVQELKLFGRANYQHYNFLIKATYGDGETLEHRSSAEYTMPIWLFTAPRRTVNSYFDFAAHEYTHSWNGKSVRPYDLWQPEFSTPQRGSLLWVYEGLTEYWGVVLAARSGFASPETSKDFLAEMTAHLTNEAGRSWRTLLDCTNDNAAPVRRPGPWNSYRRWQDFYYEGVLMWLEADQIIRTASSGRKSLDDFAKVFFPLQDSDARTRTYHLPDVIDALKKVQPYDWKRFFLYHLTAFRPDITSGLERSGYKLIYTETPNALMRAEDVGGMAYSTGERRDLDYSIGATVGASGDVEEVIWGGPAFHAGLTEGSKIDSVDGRPFTLRGLVDAILSPRGASAPILLGTSALGFQHQLAIKWQGGLRYPHLERNGQPPLLDMILAPR